MKATIYNRDGTVNQILDTFDDYIFIGPGCYGFSRDEKTFMQTTLPMCVEGVTKGMKVPEAETISICLINDSGITIRRWNGCRGLSNFNGGYYFYGEDATWRYISGNVIVES